MSSSSSGNSGPSAPTPKFDPSPEQYQNPNIQVTHNQMTTSIPQASPSFDPSQFDFPLQSQMFPGTTSHRSPSYSAFPPGTVNFGFPPRQDVMRFDGSDTASVNSRNQPSPYKVINTGSDATRPSPQDLSMMEGNFRRPALPASAYLQQHTHQAIDMSLPPSRAGSVGAEDILGPDHITNPLGAMSNMAGLVEAAVKRAKDESGDSSTDNGNGKRTGGERESDGPAIWTLGSGDSAIAVEGIIFESKVEIKAKAYTRVSRCSGRGPGQRGRGKRDASSVSLV
jgi:hypothetical protein